jgi:predicted nucleotidyltransferase
VALSENKVIEIVTGFLSRLKKEIPIREAYLFGSYADGDPKEHSDIDIAVISDWFEGKTKIENMQYLSRFAASYNSLVEAIPFTEMEYQNPDNRTFLSHVIKTGRKLSDLLEQ